MNKSLTGERYEAFCEIASTIGLVDAVALVRGFLGDEVAKAAEARWIADGGPLGRVLVYEPGLVYALELVNGRELVVWTNTLVAESDPVYAPVAAELAAGDWVLEHEYIATDEDWICDRVRCQTYMHAGDPELAR